MSETTGDRVFRRNPEVTFTRFGEEMLVVVPRTSWQIVLNGVGARVFELLDGHRGIAGIAAMIMAEYEGAEAGEVAADVSEVLGELAGKGAVQEVQA